jgi:hypothetical protein
MYNQLSAANRLAPNRVARTKARMQMAVALLPSAPALPWQAMAAFLEEMVPAAQSPGAEPDVAFGVTVASDWNSLTWHVVDERSRLLGRMGENVQRAGAPASALLPLIQMSVALGSERLGCWCKGAATGLTAGWSLPVDVPIEKASGLLPSHQAGDCLWQWATSAGVEVYQQVEQSYLGSASHTAVQLPLPGEEPTAQFGNAFALFEKLGVEGVPDAIVAAIVALVPKTTRLSIFAELSNTGLTQIGVVVPKPSLRLILHLHEARASEGNGDHNDKVAAFQGMLGAANLESVRCVQAAQGFHLSYTFFPLGYDV